MPLEKSNSYSDILESYNSMTPSIDKEEQQKITQKTISDLRASDHSMQALYESVTYREHLKGRSNKQTVMLGFSDGTKDGGYLIRSLSRLLLHRPVCRARWWGH